MKSWCAMGVVLTLAACAGTPYDPHVMDIQNADQVAKDKADCAAMAKTYQRPVNLVGVATATGEGVAGNLSTGVGGITGPLLGGAGGFLNVTLEWLGLVDTDTPRAMQQCVRQRLDRDHAGILVEPPL